MKKSYAFLSVLLFSNFIFAQEDSPLPPQSLSVKLLAEVTPKGQKVTALALQYEDAVLAGNNLKEIFEINTILDNKEPEKRTILRTYTNSNPEISSKAKEGNFVIIELDENDKNSSLYHTSTKNDTPIKVRARDKDGKVIEVEKTQTTRVPEYYQERLVYQINQVGNLKLVNGKTIAKNELKQTASLGNVQTSFIDSFSKDSVFLNHKDNKIQYRIYKPKIETGKKYPLTIFLHGSGQVGDDNLAHLISSKGAISTLQQEAGFVLAPQYATIFDPFDDVKKGQKGGVHWQTENRINLLLTMIDENIQKYPEIDKDRIYLIGLSRGSEGALNLILKRPEFFAGALLLSGREAYSLDWIAGNATKQNMKMIKNVPLWLFHSKEDKISPVEGSRKNYSILKNELGAKNVKYTEFTMEKVGDNGIVNNNPHNTWDAVFDSPAVINWLLKQRKVQ